MLRARLLVACVALVLGLVAPTAALAQGLFDPRPESEAPTLPSLVLTGAGGVGAPSAATIGMQWDTGDGTPGHVTRSIDGGPFLTIAYGNRGTTEFTGEDLAKRQVFRVEQIGVTPAVLLTAVFQHGHFKVLSVRRPIPPRRTSAAVDRLLQVSPILLALLFAVLGVRFVRSVRLA